MPLYPRWRLGRASPIFFTSAYFDGRKDNSQNRQEPGRDVRGAA